jgi:hypothetical protein
MTSTCNTKNPKTIREWKDALKELDQRSLEEVTDKIRMEGRKNEE